ncbi:MAG: hypothetical protein ACLQUW_03895 [Desulfobaccales bacterium]
MPQELFYNVPIVVILLASIGLFILATEAGFLLGRRSQSAVDEPSQSQIFAIQGAILGLLALLLGFAYAMATFRYDTRRQFLLEEANVIDKTFLRAQLLPEPPREEVSNLLRRYVELRLEAGNSAKALRKVSEATERLHKRLWLDGVAVAEKDQGGFASAVTTGLFLHSLNEMIDLNLTRITTLENHVPEVTLMLLYFIAVMGNALIGYGCGLSGVRNFFLTIISSVLIAAVIMVIIDFDRPTHGYITVSMQPTIDLQNSLKEWDSLKVQ